MNNYGILTNPLLHVCFIDKKWLYRVSRRRSLKVLPKGDQEQAGNKKYTRPKVLSRRFPVEAMSMGVVRRPILHRNFDRKILMERVSRTKYLQTAISHHNFSCDALVNSAIKIVSGRNYYQNRIDLWRIYLQSLVRRIIWMIIF